MIDLQLSLIKKILFLAVQIVLNMTETNYINNQSLILRSWISRVN